MSFDLPFGARNLNPEGSSNLDESYGYYNSVSEALSSIPRRMRKGGRTAAIRQADGYIVEYWWANDDDLTDNGFVIKSLQLGSTETTAHRGDHGKHAYDSVIETEETDFSRQITDNLNF